MPTTIRLPLELEANIKELAESHSRTEHGEMLHALREYVQREKRRIKMSGERLAVIAHFLDKEAGGNTSQSAVAFGWGEAQEIAAEMRKSIKRQYGVKCHIEISPDKPNLDRSYFHGI
jgi:predicted transcriptional regulator